MSASDFQHRIDGAIEAVKGRSVPGTFNLVTLGFVAWGLLGLGYGFGTGKAAWTWGALLVAIFYAICLGQGGLMFSVIMHGTFGRWGRPLKRVAEGFAVGLFVPLVLLALFFAAGGLTVYPWSPTWHGGDPVSLAPHGSGVYHSKEFWLEPGFFSIRQLAGLVVLLVLDFLLIRNSLRPDLVLAKQKLGAAAPAWWDRLIGSASSPSDEAKRSAVGNQVLVPVLAMSYALMMSMFAFDMVMSLDPWWFSNMFGGWIFMSSVLMGLAALAVVATLGRDWLSLGPWIKPNVTHDLGKLMLAGTMFWAYTLFAQILPIYYTDVPEETNFLLVRMVLPQWSWMARLVAILCFLAPFTILLSRGLKKLRWPFFGVALVSLTGLFFERSLLVMPSVYLGDAFPAADFLIINVGVWLGVVGLFAQVVARFLATVPAVPVADPLLEDHPWDVHVHAAGHAHG
ncbi:MAG: hypothetical protein H6732_08600 [Alphaproteobacteria bacterium]|nr:hypothetical protein [Alphaproteobacteria bacterium]